MWLRCVSCVPGVSQLRRVCPNCPVSQVWCRGAKVAAGKVTPACTQTWQISSRGSKRTPETAVTAGRGRGGGGGGGGRRRRGV